MAERPREAMDAESDADFVGFSSADETEAETTESETFEEVFQSGGSGNPEDPPETDATDFDGVGGLPVDRRKEAVKRIKDFVGDAPYFHRIEGTGAEIDIVVDKNIDPDTMYMMKQQLDGVPVAEDYRLTFHESGRLTSDDLLALPYQVEEKAS